MDDSPRRMPAFARMNPALFHSPLMYPSLMPPVMVSPAMMSPTMVSPRYSYGYSDQFSNWASVSKRVQACTSVSKRFQALDWLLTAHKYIIGFQN